MSLGRILSCSSLRRNLFLSAHTRRQNTRCLTGNGNGLVKPILTRGDLAKAKRIVVKLGSNVIIGESDTLAIGRIGSLVEQIVSIQKATDHALNRREIIVVSSGSVAHGRSRARKEMYMNVSFKNLQQINLRKEINPRSAAAIGQAGLTRLYQTLFNEFGVSVGQVLLTKSDLNEGESRVILKDTMEDLLSMDVIPILNANDSVSEPYAPDESDYVYKMTDNDSLASYVAVEMNADLLILLSDVNGIYSGPPSSQDSRHIAHYHPEMFDQIVIGEKSGIGRGGMRAKLEAAHYACNRDCAVVIANGLITDNQGLIKIIQGKPVGTLVTKMDPTLPKQEVIRPVEDLATQARRGSRSLQRLTPDERAKIIEKIAFLLKDKEAEIIKANKKDLGCAYNLSAPLKSRLELTSSKLSSLAEGLKQMAKESRDTIGKVLKATEISEGLIAEQVTVPIGVLMVIFESRPDCLPQVAGLALSTGNGLLLKGGKEAVNTNKYLHSLIVEAAKEYISEEDMPIILVDTREAVSELLSLEGKIDLVIPRGGNELVKSVMEQVEGRVPVLGHTEGICHVYIHADADVKRAIEIVEDSKCGYPAACNAMETLLVHKDLFNSELYHNILQLLSNQKVKVHRGKNLSKQLGDQRPSADFRKEYCSKECNLEIVDGLDDAIAHINTYGSSHTDTIVTQSDGVAEQFLRDVDSACVFQNTSTRFSDGYRLGLGAEVGISTGRIHARGPVGLEGLLTTKWRLKGNGHTVNGFNEGHHLFTHKQLLKAH